jgi:hypothetical protein
MTASMHNGSKYTKNKDGTLVARDDKGRIMKGCTGNPNGRPKKENRLLRFLTEELEKENDLKGPQAEKYKGLTWDELIAKQLVRRAAAGDKFSIQMVFGYKVGMPAQRIEVDKPQEVLLLNAPVVESNHS